MDQLSFVTFDDMGYDSTLGGEDAFGNDLWGWTDPLTRDEYVIVGMSGGTAFVRITDPYNPQPLAMLYTQ